MMTIKENCDKIPEFNICFDQQFVKTPEQKLSRDKFIPHYPIAVFSFSIYRMPGNKILTVFLPLFILGIFVLSCFKIDPSLDNMLPNLGMLLLAYVAFLPTVRAEIPSVSYATLTDVIIYSYLTSCLVTLLYSLVCENYTDVKSYFVAFCSFLVFWPVFSLLVLFCGYRFKRQSYLVHKRESFKKFDPKRWTVN